MGIHGANKVMNLPIQNSIHSTIYKRLTFERLQLRQLSTNKGDSESPVMIFTTDLIASSSLVALNFPFPPIVSDLRRHLTLCRCSFRLLCLHPSEDAQALKETLEFIGAKKYYYTMCLKNLVKGFYMNAITGPLDACRM
jgi:hypothetical protein